MRELEKRVSRAWRRLRAQRFLAAFVWCLAGFWLVAAGAIAAERFGLVRALPGEEWAPLAVGAGAAVLVALGVAVFSGPGRFEAAIALDRAFHLDERVSTALALPEATKATPAGQALIGDAVKHVKDLSIGEKFALVLPKRSWAPILPAALAALALLVPVDALQALTQKESAKPATEQEKKALTKTTEALVKKIAAKREALDPQKHAETAKLLAEVEKATNELTKAPTSKDQMMSKLNKLSEELKERRKELGSTDQVAKQLQQLKEMAISGPADQFAKDLMNQDFKKATEAIKDLKQKLASGKMSEEEKKKLANQLQDMKKQLEKLANLEERKKQLEQAKAKGEMNEEQFKKEMDKLKEQAKGLEQLKGLGEQLAKAAEKMEKGDMKGAAEELGMTEQQLQDLAQAAAEIEAIDASMADLQEAKNGMASDGGANQFGEGDGQFGMGDGMNNRKGGQGLGRGRGDGDRPIAPDDVASYTTKVKQQLTKGAGVIEGLGPKGIQSKGASLIEGQATVDAAAGLETEALTNQKVPNAVKKHIKGYFDSIKGDQ